MGNGNIEINIKELMYITENAETFYTRLKDIIENDIEGTDPFYTLVAMSMLITYRQTPELQIKDELLYFYSETVKAIINKDETYLKKLKDILSCNNAEQYTSVEYLQYVFRGVIYMTRKDRVVKLLNQEEMTLNRLLLFFQDNNLILDNKDLYEDLEKATENNKIIQEELAY